MSLCLPYSLSVSIFGSTPLADSLDSTSTPFCSCVCRFHGHSGLCQHDGLAVVFAGSTATQDCVSLMATKLLAVSMVPQPSRTGTGCTWSRWTTRCWPTGRPSPCPTGTGPSSSPSCRHSSTTPPTTTLAPTLRNSIPSSGEPREREELSGNGSGRVGVLNMDSRRKGAKESKRKTNKQTNEQTI